MIFEAFLLIVLYIYSFFRNFNKNLRKMCMFTLLLAFISIYNASFLLHNDELVYQKILLLNILISLVHIIDHNVTIKNERHLHSYAFVMTMVIMLHGIIMTDLYSIDTNYVNTILMAVTAIIICYVSEMVATKTDSEKKVIDKPQLKTNYYICLIVILTINYYNSSY